MKLITQFFLIILLFNACSKVPDFPDESSAKILFDDLPKTYLSKSSFEELPNWGSEDYSAALDSFINSCRSVSTQKLYKELCIKAENTEDAMQFLQGEFDPYKVNTAEGDSQGLLTGYYEPHLQASLTKKEPYIYPIYTTPNDLITVDLSSIYPELKDFRLRGRIEGKKLVPYYTRQESRFDDLDAEVICYTDSKIDRFFLEIQGSGRVTLDTGETMFIGFDNQNGHKYSAIGRYLVQMKELNIEEVSLQSIRAWLLANPHRMDEVLNYNKSVVYFRKTEQAASGSLGLELTPKRSIAVDRRYIPLGSMLYLNAEIKEKSISRLVLAQDTGGAIKGPVRADIFLGYGDEAMNFAGELKAPLRLWILLPKNRCEQGL
ncbi:MltA domain-containing protein [bacterium]|nr:MltA domain-containing protein [bacterium]MBU1991315.1 MltA domain-containing protein [bacterium]